jgi:hypothetical protein
VFPSTTEAAAGARREGCGQSVLNGRFNVEKASVVHRLDTMSPIPFNLPIFSSQKKSLGEASILLQGLYRPMTRTGKYAHFPRNIHHTLNTPRKVSHPLRN